MILILDVVVTESLQVMRFPVIYIVLQALTISKFATRGQYSLVIKRQALEYWHIRG